MEGRLMHWASPHFFLQVGSQICLPCCSSLLGEEGPHLGSCHHETGTENTTHRRRLYRIIHQDRIRQLTGLVWGLRPMITRVGCRVTVEAEGSTGAGFAAWHSCSAGRLLAAPSMGVTS